MVISNGMIYYNQKTERGEKIRGNILQRLGKINSRVPKEGHEITVEPKMYIWQLRKHFIIASHEILLANLNKISLAKNRIPLFQKII